MFYSYVKLQKYLLSDQQMVASRNGIWHDLTIYVSKFGLKLQ